MLRCSPPCAASGACGAHNSGGRAEAQALVARGRSVHKAVRACGARSCARPRGGECVGHTAVEGAAAARVRVRHSRHRQAALSGTLRRSACQSGLHAMYRTRACAFASASISVIAASYGERSTASCASCYRAASSASAARCQPLAPCAHTAFQHTHADADSTAVA